MSTMPKVLNVVKLHKKFASLTRSKESIQSLAGYIIHHKEFHEDIVNEWLVGLSKDYNALVMFYVANEVIQNCGKKRVPEFREDFAKILKKAVSLEKVKEIKDNVIRLMSFWRERDIYDENFIQELQSILNSEEIKVDPDPEPTEEEVIARFKKEKLFENLEKLKTAVADREEKEEILNYADEPVTPDSSVSLVQKECQDMIEKCEKYLKLVEETINLTCKEVRVKKLVLEDLKDCCVFYSAQSRDVKEVANMFRIYGRKLKIMEKKVSEKKASLENTEPNFSPSLNSPNSVCSYVSFSDNDSTSVFERISKVSQDSPVLSSHETDNSEMQKSFFALLNHDKNNETLLAEGSIPDPGIEKLEGNSLNSEDAIKEEQCNLTQDKPKPGSNKEGDLNDIDFLLDESYDCKKGNPKPMLKRKAEIRLKLKEKRVCTENISESSNPKTSDEPFKISSDENIMKSLRGDSINTNITEKEKDSNLELSTNGVKGNDSVLSESLLDQNKTVLNNELPNKKDDAIESVMILETPLQKSQIIDEFSNKKADKDDSVMILEVPLQKDKTVLNDVLPSKKVNEDCVMILDAPLKDKSVLNDTLSNVKADESDSGMILKAPLVEDKTVLNAEQPSEKADKDSLLILHTTSTHTEPHLNLSDRSKDGFESTELEGKFSSTMQKELASDSISIENKPDDFIPNTDKMKPKLSFENCVVPAEASQCSEPQSIQTKSDSDAIPKTHKVPKDELNGETPNLLGNLQKVLECICNDQIMDLKTRDSEKESFLPLENYIAIYGALCCPDPVVKPPLQEAGSVFRQNEVVDMECETDEES